VSTTAQAPVARAEARALLLAAIQTQRGEWTTGRVKRLYRKHLPTHILRVTMRRDLTALHAAGHLVLHEAPNRRYYTYCTKGGTA
jgi:hypothetical protein